jgi:hypothetical protein
VLRPLGEADTRIEHDSISGDTDLVTGPQTLPQLSRHFGHDILVLGLGVHMPAMPAPVHRHIRHGGFRNGCQHLLISQPTADIVDQHRARRNRVGRQLRPHGVDADRHTGRTETLNDWQHPAALLGRRNPQGARSGGLTADVHQVGALRHQGDARRDRQLRLDESATVAERIGGDVEHPHHQRAALVRQSDR